MGENLYITGRSYQTISKLGYQITSSIVDSWIVYDVIGVALDGKMEIEIWCSKRKNVGVSDGHSIKTRGILKENTLTVSEEYTRQIETFKTMYADSV